MCFFGKFGDRVYDQSVDFHMTTTLAEIQARLPRGVVKGWVVLQQTWTRQSSSAERFVDGVGVDCVTGSIPSDRMKVIYYAFYSSPVLTYGIPSLGVTGVL